MDRKPTHSVKMAVVGQTGVGKSSLSERFATGRFREIVDATIGAAFLSMKVNRPTHDVQLQIWDTAGQERFRSLIPSYIRDSSVAVVVYDTTSRASFLSSSKWVDDIRSERGDDVVIMLVGNKTDLADQRQVSVEEGLAKASEEKVMFIETSAKAGFNIKQLFRRLASALPGIEGAVSHAPGLIDIKLTANQNAAEISQASKCGC